MRRMVTVYIVISIKNIKIRFKVGNVVTKLFLKLSKVFVVVFMHSLGHFNYFSGTEMISFRRFFG